MAVNSGRLGGMFAVKAADAHIAHAEREGGLRRAICLVDLTALSGAVPPPGAGR